MKRKEIWVKLIFILIVFSLFSYNFIYKFKTNYKGENFLKSSDNEISIATPENKTYSGPMSGYYPATYGFENDINGVEPNEWLRWDPGIGTVRVISEKVGHKKVLEVNDDASPTGDDPGIYQLFSEDHNSGIIELWVYKESGNCPIWISLLDTSLVRYITVLGIDSYVSQYNNNRFNINSDPGGWQTFGPTFYDDQWYHISISWNGTTKTVGVYINGILEADDYSYTHTDAIDADRLEIRSAWGTTGLFYIDAIGFSWNPNYNIGDNFNEGLLLNFENLTTLDWMGYSLDGLANKTILGNATLPLPANGAHNIQMFGNDSLGTIYASNLRHFTLDVPMIDIITPENKTYIEPMSGYYPGTYSFDNDQDNDNPEDWVDLSGTNCDAQIITEKSGHKKVLELSDNSGSNIAQVTQTFNSAQVIGEVEWWWSSDDVTKLSRFQIYASDDTQAIVIQIASDKFQYYDSPTLTDISGVTPLNGIWYHLKLIFDCSSDTFDLYIDGTLRLKDGNFRNVVNDYEWLRFQTSDSDSSYYQYIDAVGYTWDPNYNIGDNFNEGLLLSFENRTTLDWRGYSLDGLANKTILGDITIPFLSDGSHSIQVFGNDSLGTIYESEIRYFSINAPTPSISILTPLNDNFYSNIAPSFSISITAFSKITTWYTLDDGGTNITFTGLSRTINQTEWDEKGEVPITIRFYANDSFGRFNYAEITINKDITDPVITINSPLFDDQFTTMPPRFNISIDELNIDAIWYTIDGGLTYYTISEYSGYINSAAWNLAPNGVITISFYVIDKAGNIGYEDVIVQKSSPPYIPPDNSFIIIISVTIGALSIFIGFLLILYIILSRKRKYEPYKFKEPIKPEIRVKAKYGYLICPYCHNENYIKHNYCIYCGASLADFKPNNI